MEICILPPPPCPGGAGKGFSWKGFLPERVKAFRQDGSALPEALTLLQSPSAARRWGGTCPPVMVTRSRPRSPGCHTLMVSPKLREASGTLCAG